MPHKKLAAYIQKISKYITGKAVFKFFTIYTGFNFLNQAIPFLMLPVLTRLLTPRDYGAIATFTAIVPIFTILLSLGTADAVIRGYFDKGKKDFDISKMLSNALLINGAIFVLFFVGAVVYDMYHRNGDVFGRVPAFLFPIIGCCAVVYSITSKLFVVQEKPFQYASLELSNTLTEMLLSIGFILVGFGWFGRVLGISISNVIFAGIALIILCRMYPLKLSFDLSYIKSILTYGLPVVCHSLGIVLIAAIDRIFLNRLCGLSETGLYGVAYSMMSIVTFFVSAFNFAWIPFFYKKLNHANESDKRRLVIAAYVYFLLMLILAIGALIIVPVALKYIVGKQFLGSARFLPWLAFAFAVNGMYAVVGSYILYSKKTHYLAIIAVITVLASVCLNYLLIRLNGPIGAAQATFFVLLLRFILCWIFGNIAYPMPWFRLLAPRRGQIAS